MSEGDCAGRTGTRDEETLVFDSTGVLVGPRIETPDILRPRSCSLQTLDGSWLLTIEAQIPNVFSPQVRGPMRIEVGSNVLRVSGDIYVQRRFTFPPPTEIERPSFIPIPDPGPLPDPIDPLVSPAGAVGDGAPGTTSYPSFPKGQYSWYFRSTGVTYSTVTGQLNFSLVRHLWDKTSQEFSGTDTGRMTLTCKRSIVTRFGTPATMTGTLSIGGNMMTVRATKTSDFYRGCRIEVDVMTNRTFPASATIGSGATADLRSVYGTAGWDVTFAVDEINVPEDASLTNAELNTLLSGHAAAPPGETWRLWLFVGSSQGGLFGIMFDDDTVPREGAAGFADATLGGDSVILPSARNRPLDEVPAAFLRTLVHEAGHAFNLFHPKHDTHAPPIGTQIMNQTGDVIGFATTTNQYPNNASFLFSSHDRDSLIHSPDPQVRPGWKNFGWGHGSLSAGLPAPVDASGLVAADDADGLDLVLNLPGQIFVGEYVTASVRLTNTGDASRDVTTRLNLAEGDLRLLRVDPNGAVDQVRDIVVACGPRPMMTLAPGGSVEAQLQVYFTSAGFTFATPGRHQVLAELEVDPFTSVRSAAITVDVRPAATETELDIAAATLDTGVGRAIALGDFGSDGNARQLLTSVAESHSDSDTGAACALVMANALARTHVDHRANVTRDAEVEDAAHFLDLAIRGRSADRVLELAVTVASPVEKDAPVVADAVARVKKARKAKADVDRAVDIAANFEALATH